jgi:hypothetical protein
MYICMVLSEVILWLRVRVTSTHSADVIIILKVFVESWLVPQYHPMHLLKQNVLFAITSYSTVNCFEIWSRFDRLCTSKKPNHLETVLQILTALFIQYVPYVGFQNENLDTVLHMSVTDTILKCRNMTQCIANAAIILEVYEPCSDR